MQLLVRYGLMGRARSPEMLQTVQLLGGLAEGMSRHHHRYLLVELERGLWAGWGEGCRGQHVDALSTHHVA